MARKKDKKETFVKKPKSKLKALPKSSAKQIDKVLNRVKPPPIRFSKQPKGSPPQFMQQNYSNIAGQRVQPPPMPSYADWIAIAKSIVAPQSTDGEYQKQFQAYVGGKLDEQERRLAETFSDITKKTTPQQNRTLRNAMQQPIFQQPFRAPSPGAYRATESEDGEIIEEPEPLPPKPPRPPPPQGPPPVRDGFAQRAPIVTPLTATPGRTMLSAFQPTPLPRLDEEEDIPTSPAYFIDEGDNEEDVLPNPVDVVAEATPVDVRSETASTLSSQADAVDLINRYRLETSNETLNRLLGEANELHTSLMNNENIPLKTKKQFKKPTLQDNVSVAREMDRLRSAIKRLRAKIAEYS